MSDWFPTTYLKFEDERTRPARDLLAQVPVTVPRLVVDMGCGPGNSTELLIERFNRSDVIGLDRSPAMLEAARQRLPDTRFELADASAWLPPPGTELLFANAVYQWVPDHLAVLTRQLQALGSGAVLAVQMPDNMAEPTHALMKTVAANGPWAERLKNVARQPLAPVRTFYDALKPHAARLDIWHTAYNHVLTDAAAVVEWVSSTGLRPFIDPLSPDERKDFLAQYQALIEKAYPLTVDGKVLLRFPRLFIVAVRA